MSTNTYSQYVEIQQPVNKERLILKLDDALILVRLSLQSMKGNLSNSGCMK